MKKILVFSETFYPVVGGMESNTETLLQALLELGHQATLLTASKLNGKPELQAPYKIIREKSPLRFQKELKNIDLLIINGDISIPACLMAFLNKIPYIIIYQMAGKIVPRQAGLLHNYLYKLRLFLGSKAVYHLGVSNACIQSKNVCKKGEGVLYNPISKELFGYANNLAFTNLPKEYDLLFAGRVIAGKGIDVLADALEILDNKKFVCTVLISGEGEAQDRLYHKTSKFQNVKVDFQTFVKGEKLAVTYAKSKIMVLPSTTHQEGSPLSIVEAFAFGLPVIVSNQKVMIELIGADAGLIHESGNAIDLSKTIEEGLDKNRYFALSKSAKKQSDKFTYVKYVNTLNRILNLMTIHL